MATIEMNMLSVITCGSISVRVFCPGMDRLALDDKEHRVKYPVLWLLHTDGGAAIDWLETPAERIAEKYGIFLIAPDQHHAMGTDMAFGPRYESFLHTELLNICRNCLPISEDPAENWIGGVGTGAYGAVKMALKHPDVFSKAVAINGILDMEALIAKAVAGEDTGTPHNRASLEAVFGDPCPGRRTAPSISPGRPDPRCRRKMSVWPPCWAQKPRSGKRRKILTPAGSVCRTPSGG